MYDVHLALGALSAAWRFKFDYLDMMHQSECIDERKANQKLSSVRCSPKVTLFAKK